MSFKIDKSREYSLSELADGFYEATDGKWGTDEETMNSISAWISEKEHAGQGQYTMADFNAALAGKMGPERASELMNEYQTDHLALAVVRMETFFTKERNAAEDYLIYAHDTAKYGTIDSIIKAGTNIADLSDGFAKCAGVAAVALGLGAYIPGVRLVAAPALAIMLVGGIAASLGGIAYGAFQHGAATDEVGRQAGIETIATGVFGLGAALAARKQIFNQVKKNGDIPVLKAARAFWSDFKEGYFAARKGATAKPSAKPPAAPELPPPAQAQPVAPSAPSAQVQATTQPPTSPVKPPTAAEPPPPAQQPPPVAPEPSPPPTASGKAPAPSGPADTKPAPHLEEPATTPPPNPAVAVANIPTDIWTNPEVAEGVAAVVKGVRGNTEWPGPVPPDVNDLEIASAAREYFTREASGKGGDLLQGVLGLTKKILGSQDRSGPRAFAIVGWEVLSRRAAAIAEGKRPPFSAQGLALPSWAEAGAPELSLDSQVSQTMITQTIEAVRNTGWLDDCAAVTNANIATAIEWRIKILDKGVLGLLRLMRDDHEARNEWLHIATYVDYMREYPGIPFEAAAEDLKLYSDRHGAAALAKAWGDTDVQIALSHVLEVLETRRVRIQPPVAKSTLEAHVKGTMSPAHVFNLSQRARANPDESWPSFRDIIDSLLRPPEALTPEPGVSDVPFRLQSLVAAFRKWATPNPQMPWLPTTLRDSDILQAIWKTTSNRGLRSLADNIRRNKADIPSDSLNAWKETIIKERADDIIAGALQQIIPMLRRNFREELAVLSDDEISATIKMRFTVNQMVDALEELATGFQGPLRVIKDGIF